MATKTVFQCDHAGVYIGQASAHESPLEPGVFNLPGGCTFAPPPALAEHEAAKWDGEAWAVVPDRRGETWFDGREPITIDFVGDPTGRGYTAEPPPPTLEALRAAKIADIVAIAETRLSAGAPVAGALHVALDDGSRADLTAMAATAIAAAAGSIPWPDSYSQGWIAIENVRIPLATPADGLALAASVGNYYTSIVQHRRDLKDAVLAATDAAAVEAIDINAGWPSA